MGSSVSLLVLMLAVRADAVPPATVAAQVADCLAREWSVPASRIRLAWGRLPGEMPAGDTPVRVAGTAADGWSVVVFGSAASTTAVRVRAGVEDSVPVAARALPAGSTLGPGDFRLEPRMHWGPPASCAGPRPGTGWQARRPLAAGEELARPAVALPPLIAAGEPIKLMWAGGAVQICLTGIALNSAREGESVRARVPGRRGTLVGKAIAAGTAALVNGGTR